MVESKRYAASWFAVLGAPLLWLIVAAALFGWRRGFAYPVGHGLPEELVDWLGLSLGLGGTMWVALYSAPGQILGWRSPALWAVAGGFALILGQVLLCLLLEGVFLGWMLCRPAGQGVRPRSSWVEAVRAEALPLLAVASAGLMLELWENSVAPGGAEAHAVEMGCWLVVLALLGIAWSAASERIPVAALRKANPVTAIRGRLRAALLLLALFGLMIAAIQIPAVQRLDLLLGQGAYKAGPKFLTHALQHVSAAGGRDLMLFWLPATVVGLVVLRLSSGIRFYLAVMIGAPGLEVVFKGLTHRARPPFVRGDFMNSFPSGHVLAATVLAATLLILVLPLCRRRGWKALVWTVAVAWPVLMSASRVYLGRHYVTDVVAAMLLGVGWVLFCQAVHLALSHAGIGRARASVERSVLEPAPCA